MKYLNVVVNHIKYVSLTSFEMMEGKMLINAQSFEICMLILVVLLDRYSGKGAFKCIVLTFVGVYFLPKHRFLIIQ